LNVHGVNDVRQTENHTAEPLVPEPSTSEVEMAIDKLRRHKSPDTDPISAELIKAGGRTILYEIHKLINSIWNKEESSEQWKESIIVTICKKGDKTECSNYQGISLLSTAYKILSNKGGGMPLQHYFLAKIRLLATEFKKGKQKIEMLSKRLFGWYKDRKMKRTASYRMQNRGF
jgi:hypothetical protein